MRRSHGCAGAAHHHAGKAPCPGVRQLDDADVDVALLEDAVSGEQGFDIVADPKERIAEGLDVVDQLAREILVDAARTEIGRVHARAARALVEHHQLLALLEPPEDRGHRADVVRRRRDLEHMRQNAADLAIEDADELGAARRGDPEQALDRQRVGVLLVHRRDIIQPIEVGHVLQIGSRLHQLLGAAMQQADMRIDPLDQFAVELQHEAQHAVRGGMLRAEIHREGAEVLFGHGNASRIGDERAGLGEW